MREIKFRAWDKIDKRLIIDKQDFIPLVVTNKGVFKLDPTCEYDRWIEIDKNRFDFMQYTGLKDKNGVEIYEGDIVKIKRTKFEIRWDLFGCCFCRYKYSAMENFYLGIWDKENIEVIGNIYENPELLN